MLYTLISNYHEYLGFYFDREQIKKALGEMDENNLEKHIDIYNAPRSYIGVFNEPLNFDFTSSNKEDNGKKIPEISVVSGRLFLSQNAFDVLHPLIKNDGEFLPVIYQKGQGYFFIPFRVANVDPKVTVKNEWEDILSIGFLENEVNNWSLFRTEFDAYRGVYCQSYIKDAIEKAELKGLFITSDLANIFPEDRSSVEREN